MSFICGNSTIKIKQINKNSMMNNCVDEEIQHVLKSQSLKVKELLVSRDDSSQLQSANNAT
jgi:hypothetical protein